MELQINTLRSTMKMEKSNGNLFFTKKTKPKEIFIRMENFKVKRIIPSTCSMETGFKKTPWEML